MLKTGDKVQMLNEAGICVVIAVRGALVTVKDAHGFEWLVPAGELLPVAAKADLHNALNSAEPAVKAADAGKKSAAVPAASPKVEEMEIDLHIHELTDNQRHMTNHEMVTLQLVHLRKALLEARTKRANKLVVIHGVGKGVLKTEIRKVLDKEERCSYEDGNYLTYGRGATEIRLW